MKPPYWLEQIWRNRRGRARGVLAFKLNDPHECPLCGHVSFYGERRTLWSLLPGICDHAVIDHGVRPSMEDMKGMEWVSTRGPVKPVHRPFAATGGLIEETFVGNLRGYLSQRLTDEFRGYRQYWWGPLTKKQRREIREFRRSMKLKPTTVYETIMEAALDAPLIKAGQRALERVRADFFA